MGTRRRSWSWWLLGYALLACGVVVSYKVIQRRQPRRAVPCVVLSGMPWVQENRGRTLVVLNDRWRERRWWPFSNDSDGRIFPAAWDGTELEAVVELDVQPGQHVKVELEAFDEVQQQLSGMWLSVAPRECYHGDLIFELNLQPGQNTIRGLFRRVSASEVVPATMVEIWHDPEPAPPVGHRVRVQPVE